VKLDQRITFFTIGVDNLEKVKQFYIDVFGWKPMKDDNGIVFFKLNGFILSLFPNNELAKDAGVKNDGKGFKRSSLAINFNSEKEVDKIFKSLKEKGVKILKPPQKVFWGGYHCYIADVENNLWEIAYNPFLKMDKKGNVGSHK
jgi:predicted enzyme related to lactoylglutathione lyase